MIFLKLFITFFQIGLFTFGGGYAMISLISEKVTAYGWLTEEELLNMIAVSESTPGPIAINMATFVGSDQGGVLGAICATLGVVLPSFIIILLISSVITGFLKHKSVKAVLSGIRPCVIGLIMGVAITTFISTLLGFSTETGLNVDIRDLAIFALVLLVGILSQKLVHKKISPILLILISAGLGMIVYSV